jgi:hypothetical protein
MKKSELKSFIKENIVDTLTESPSSEEVRMARQAVARFMKYRNVGETEAIRDLINALKEIQPKEDDQRYIDYLRRSGRDKEADKLVGKNSNLKEDVDDEDDVDAKAIKAAKGARGKHKKLDLAIKALKSISTEMKSLARKYSAGDEAEKEKIKNILRTKTPQKKELESLVAKLEKDVV